MSDREKTGAYTPGRGLVFGGLCLGAAALLLAAAQALDLGSAVDQRYFAHLAASFWDGRLDLVGVRPDELDVSPYQGAVYIYWPPLVALSMLPIVAFTGAELFPQRLFAIGFGALNIGLFYLVFTRLAALGARRSEWERIALALIFGLGTSNLIFALKASHWFVGQLVPATFTLLALYFALDRAPETRRRAALASFLAVAFAILGRTHLILALPLFLFLALGDREFRLPGARGFVPRFARSVFTPENFRFTLCLAAPIVVALACFAAYNTARFGDPFETGLSHHNMNPVFRRDFESVGAFSLHYLPRNLYYTLLRLPGFQRFDGAVLAMGFSLFAQSPILLLAIGRRVSTERRDLAAALWLAIAPAAGVILLVMGTGWVQFGARYLFDIVPFLALLVLLKLPERACPWLVALGGLSLAVNAYGVLAVCGKLAFPMF